MKYREKYAETVNKEMELTNALMNQIMPPHISKTVRLGRPYGDTCEVSLLLTEQRSLNRIFIIR